MVGLERNHLLWTYSRGPNSWFEEVLLSIRLIENTINKNHPALVKRKDKNIPPGQHCMAFNEQVKYVAIFLGSFHLSVFFRIYCDFCISI